MNWIYSIKSKTTAAVLLFVVMGLVIIINYNERSNSHKINKAFSSIYEDRLMVESYIFQYSQHFQVIIDAVDNSEYSVTEKNDLSIVALAKIDALNTLYKKTKLTAEEETSFLKFTNLCSTISGSLNRGNFAQAKQLSGQAKIILHDLSSIQITEAQSQLASVNSMHSYAILTSHFEMAILIVIAVIIQALLFTSNALRAVKAPKNYNLN